MKKKLVINVSELPLRPKRLSAEETAGVFGGCTAPDGACKYDSDCCVVTKYLDRPVYGVSCMNNRCAMQLRD